MNPMNRNPLTKCFSQIVADAMDVAKHDVLEQAILKFIYISLENKATQLVIELLKRDDQHYIMFADNGIGSDDLLEMFGLTKKDAGNSRRTTGVRTIEENYISAVCCLNPLNDMLMSKKAGKNAKSLKYNFIKHQECIFQAKKEHMMNGVPLDEAYQSISENDLFEVEVKGDMYDLIHTFDGILSSDFMNIYQGIKTKQSGTTGMIMLNQINAKVYDELVGIISENSKFMRTLQISSVEMDKILFYQNGVRVNTTKEEDILSKYPSLIAVYDFYTRKQGSYRIRESMYGNVVDDEHCIFKDRILSFTNESKVINSVKKTADDIADLPHIGTMQLKFQVWSQSDWDKIQLDSQYDKRLPIFDYYGGKFRGFGKKTSSGLIKNMLGPYLFVMCITEENMDFAEKYLGAKKSLMCPNVDVFDLVASHIFIKRFNDICVGHFGNKSLHSAYEDFTSSTFGGIKDWMQYADYISEMFEVGKKYPAYNIYIKQASGEEDVAAIKRVYVKKRAQNQSPEESDTHSIYSLSPDTSPDVSPETFMRQQMKQNLGHTKKPTVIPSTNPFRSSGFGSSESFGSDDSIQLEHDEEVAIALFALNLYLKKPAMRQAIQNRKVFFNQQSGEFERVKIIQ